VARCAFNVENHWFRPSCLNVCLIKVFFVQPDVHRSVPRCTRRCAARTARPTTASASWSRRPVRRKRPYSSTTRETASNPPDSNNGNYRRRKVRNKTDFRPVSWQLVLISSTFYARIFRAKFWLQKLQSCVLGLNFFGTKILVKKAPVKCLWNWHLVLIS